MLLLKVGSSFCLLDQLFDGELYSSELRTPCARFDLYGEDAHSRRSVGPLTSGTLCTLEGFSLLYLKESMSEEAEHTARAASRGWQEGVSQNTVGMCSAEAILISSLKAQKKLKPLRNSRFKNVFFGQSWS